MVTTVLIIINVEFENTQQLKAIESEKEKIQGISISLAHANCYSILKVMYYIIFMFQ